mmetsp:Transcript_19036/g.40950  ORF Transcript_19036/g.40950 Transcript_19036/m.40950 type:complete len:129 (+) Transcript_19036:116-502(+)|eukprot:CAMPEP_0194773710 /NCGR_PEP_ID=MMETSP0323_2-20130528/55605_1 /TAXON_ID=2866 ORGANISM="Crypthecodinium cohnii, Strain Seligo" /NCGR_SAMPLE_ID=MMETSP0323_2 /ASSEMBLY_ACC=CAM_ASM_000346 /LENGTH=128 /DNA_ID=CAMNT_0039708905 /DNA_START=147 /DNA_END=533 /DNA_ORIENTATION=+
MAVTDVLLGMQSCTLHSNATPSFIDERGVLREASQAQNASRWVTISILKNSGDKATALTYVWSADATVWATTLARLRCRWNFLDLTPGLFQEGGNSRLVVWVWKGLLPFLDDDERSSTRESHELLLVS